MSNVTLKHKITKVLLSLDPEVWESWKLVPEIADVYEIVDAPDGCVDCGTSPTVDESAKTTETPAKIASSKNTSKESE